MLRIEGLTAEIDGKQILQGIDLEIPDGELHAIMGPNGSGKSTLSYVLSGRDGYEITGGSVTFNGLDLLAMEPEQRAASGLFLAFQYPVELPGVGNANFLRTALNAVRRHRGEPEVDAMQFLKLARARMKVLNMPDDMLKRNVNVGFSGGEKKKLEALQAVLLTPRFALFDEIDTGVDVDALKIITRFLKKHLPKETTLVFITHSTRLLSIIKPQEVLVIKDGRLVKTGTGALAKKIEEKGFESIK